MYKRQEGISAGNGAGGRTALQEVIFPRIYFTDAYMEGGYGAFSPQIRDTIHKVYASDGVYLDMTYTGKAFYGMMEYLKENKVCGKNILFLHTGGAPLFFDFLEAEERR